MGAPAWLKTGWLVALAWGLAANAQERRAALIVGSNEGDVAEIRLRYAESDAQQVAEVLKRYGAFEAEGMVELLAPTADEVRGVLKSLAARAAASRPWDTLVVYYSGHADAADLHLRGTRLPLIELKNALGPELARTRIVVLDACRSGAITRAKGAVPMAPFSIEGVVADDVEGLALLTSSAPDEDSLESDALQASFFTHAWVSALRGAADVNDDKNVTLGEAFDYAAALTLSSTATSVTGPQHPTYRMDLRGQQQVVLTRLQSASGLGLLRFEDAGRYFVRQGDENGKVVAEVLVGGNARAVAIVAGPYFVVQRSASLLREAKVTVVPGQQTQLREDNMQRIEHARLVRKGGSEKHVAFAVLAGATYRYSMFGLWESASAFAGLRVDFRPVSLELRVDYRRVGWANERLNSLTQEMGSSLLGTYTFDFRALSLALGIEVGMVNWVQTFSDAHTPQRHHVGMVLGPVAQLERELWNGVFLRVEASFGNLILNTGDAMGRSKLQALLTARFGAGVGFAW